VITVLTGKNDFEIQRALRQILRTSDVRPEILDGEMLEASELPTVLTGMSLFSQKRLVVLKNASANKSVWEKLDDWLGKVDDDIHLVLVEPGADKRTKTYKTLQKVADVQEHKPWDERDTRLAEKWATQEARQMGLKLDQKSVQKLVQHTGVDQWRIFHALEKLSVLDEVTPEIVAATVELNPTENVFQLFETALKGDVKRIHESIATLSRTQDPYMLFGLLASQVFQLVAVSLAEPSDTLSADFGIKPYTVSKLSPHVKKLGRAGVQKVQARIADADTELKSSPTDPWIIIERALIEIAI